MVRERVVEIIADDASGCLRAFVHTGRTRPYYAPTTDPKRIRRLIERIRSVRFHGYVSPQLVQPIKSALSVVESIEFVGCPSSTYNSILSIATNLRHLNLTQLDLSELRMNASSNLWSVRIKQCAGSAERIIPIRTSALTLTAPYDISLLKCLPPPKMNLFIDGSTGIDELHMVAIPMPQTLFTFVGNDITLTLDDMDVILSSHPSYIMLHQSRIEFGHSTVRPERILVRSLNFSDCRIDASALVALLDRIEDIEELSLPRVDLTSRLLTELSRFPSLSTLGLENCRLRARTYSTALTSVRHLYLSEHQARYKGEMQTLFPNADIA